MAESGNLMIFDEATADKGQSDSGPVKKDQSLSRSIRDKDVSKEREGTLTTSSDSLREVTFDNEDAATVIKFFDEELIQIGTDFAGRTSREPVVGQPVKVTISSRKEKHLKGFESSIEKIRKDMQSFHKEYVKYEEKRTEAEDFVRKSGDTSKALLYLDKDKRQVCIVGPIYEEVNKQLHQLKVALGQIKTTSRSKNFNTGSSTSDSSRLYPDLSGEANRSQRRGDNLSGEANRSQRRGDNLSGEANRSQRRGDNLSGEANRSQRRGDNLSGEANRSQRRGDNLSGEANRSQRRGNNYPSPDRGDIYIEETLNNAMKFKVYKASILKLNVEAIVNAANDKLMHSGGVARIIADAAGYEMEKESRDYVREHREVRETENCVTSAGKLQYKGVIHAVGPQWYRYNRDEKVNCMDEVYNTVTNIMECCNRREYRSVAMPAISAGIFGVPKELCADMYVKAVADFSRRGNQYLQEFHFVDVDKEILRMVKDSFQRWNEDEKLIDQRRIVPEYLRKHPDNTSGYYYGGQGGGHRGRRDFKTDSDSYGASASSGSSSHRDFSNSTGQGRGHRDQRNFNTDRGNFSASSSGSSSHRDFSSSTVGSPGKNRKPFNSSYSVDSNISDAGRGWEKLEDTKPGVTCRVELQPSEKVGRSSIIADCFKVNGKTKVLIYKGAIEKVGGVDAVVCAADENLKPGGVTAKALEDAGGYKYADDIREMQRKLNYDRLRKGKVAVSRGGNLKVRHVIHLVLPRVSTEKDIPLFKLAMDNVLLKANERNFKGIGMPLIGLGGIQDKLYLLDKFCEAFVETVCTFYARRPHSCLVDLHLVNFSDNVNASLNKAFINAHARQKPTNSMHGRPLPPTPTEVASQSPMEVEEEEDDTYDTLDTATRENTIRHTGHAESRRHLESSTRGRGGGGGNKNSKPYNAWDYRDPQHDDAAADDDEPNDAVSGKTGADGGRRVDKPQGSNSSVPSLDDLEKDKGKGNLMILDN